MSDVVTVQPVDGEPYLVHIGTNAVTELERIVDEEVAKVALVCDRNLAGLHAERIREVLGDRWPVETLVFPAGEKHKTRATKEMIEDRMLELKFGRDCLVLALGGGVTCDLAGFVAATYQRGVDWVALPTSLLAAVDASVGGKTGVDTPAGKNLVGAFHQPRAVLIDLQFLQSLPPGEVDNGLAEMVKHAVIADASYLDELVTAAPKIRTLDPDVLAEPIRRSVEIKSAVVSIDPREADLRQVLNCGHTVAHAIEVLAEYRISHGRAVAAGLSVEAGIAVLLGLLEADQRDRLRLALGALGLPTTPPHGMQPGALVEATRLDKKGRQGKPRYALPQALGKMARGPKGYGIRVEDKVVEQAIEEARECSA